MQWLFIMPYILFFNLTAIYCDSLCCKLCCALAACTVDIVSELTVSRVHLAKSAEYLIGTGVKMLGYKALQLLHHCLRIIAFVTALFKLSELGKKLHEVLHYLGQGRRHDQLHHQAFR